MPRWKLNLEGDSSPYRIHGKGAVWAVVDADSLDVMGDGTLVFGEGGTTCLVLRGDAYGHVQRLDWDGLTFERVGE